MPSGGKRAREARRKIVRHEGESDWSGSASRRRASSPLERYPDFDAAGAGAAIEVLAVTIAACSNKRPDTHMWATAEVQGFFCGI